ncbi:MAG: T9SS type A sorting domain-containing protein [Bacteroidota bacterium]
MRKSFLLGCFLLLAAPALGQSIHLVPTKTSLDGTITSMDVDASGTLYVGTRDADDFGLLFRSDDQGTTWDTLLHPTPEAHAWDIAVGPDEALYVLARFDGQLNLFKAEEETWAPAGAWPIASVDDASEAHVLLHRATATDALVLGTTDGVVMRSDELATSWEALAAHPDSAATLHALHSDIDGTIFTAAGAHGFLCFDEATSTWTALAAPLAADEHATHLDFTAEATLIGGSTQNIFASTDRGATWTTITPPFTQSVYAVTTVGTNILASTSSGLWLSQNGGTIWMQLLASESGYRVESITVASTGTIFLSTADELLKLHTPVITSTDDETLPQAFAVRAAYPNPFVVATTLEVTVERAAHVTATVYDVLGRQVASLHDGWQAPGAMPLRWHPTHQPSGVYFARVEANGATETQMLTLVR